MKYVIIYRSATGEYRLDGFTNTRIEKVHEDGSSTETFILAEVDTLYIQLNGNMNLVLALEPSCLQDTDERDPGDTWDGWNGDV